VKAKPQLLQDTQGMASVAPKLLAAPDGTIQQANRTIKLVSAKGVAPPIKPGQHVIASVNGVELRIDLANCCRLSKGIGAAHTKGCILKALGYAI
jgi:exosome complex RNA-binding protein Csl4